MQFSIKTSASERLKTGCLILPVAGGKESGDSKALDPASNRRINAALKSGDLPAKAGATLLLHLDGAVQRVLLVSMGESREVSAKAYCDAVRGAMRHLSTLAATEAVSLMHRASVTGKSIGWKLRQQILAARETAYRFESQKSRKDPSPVRPDELSFALTAAESAEGQIELTRAVALANGIDFAKDLGNLPGNVCNPSYLADVARKLGRSHKLKVEVLDAKQMEALGMGALLAVARGSAQPPRMIVMHYQGSTARKAPVVLVGKGITFDSGGISLKPGPEMDEMKFDMCGAASVFGTLKAVAEMKLRVNLIGVIPSAENMPSGTATRPGDVVTTMSGQTVEILNTDAEGRLILCDALTYVQRFKPAAVIDIATLTGACVIALGHHHSGLFSREDALADELLAAGREAEDSCWRMPLDDAYQEQLKSRFADMANIGGRPAGAITAACYLSRFTRDFDWAHLDIAGTAWKSGAQKGATGRPVPLLTRFLIARSDG